MRLGILALVLAIVVCLAPPLLAQVNDESVQEGNIEKLPTDRPVIEYALAGCFLLAAMAVGFKTSKRAND